MQPQSKIFLILRDTQLYLISDELEANQPYSIKINYEKGGGLSITLNGRPAITLNKKDIEQTPLEVKTFAVGTGFSLSRPFTGSISNFNASIRYTEKTSLGKFFYWLLLPLSFIGFLIGFFLLSNLLKVDLNLQCIKPVNLKKIVFSFKDIHTFEGCSIYSLTLVALTVVITPLFFLNEKYFGISKWIPFLLVPLPLLALSLQISKSKAWIGNRLLNIAPLIIYCSFLSYASIKSNQISALLIFFCGLCVCLMLFLPFKNRLIPIIISICSWLVITRLENWAAIDNLISSQSFLYLAFAGFSLIFLLLSQFTTTHTSFVSNKISWAIFLTAILTMLFLSFRSDSLFIPGSEYHWEYFVGPIRSIRNGGWLLFDAPSQYGFLNILLASALPLTSSWQSLYFLQGSILFAVSTTALLILLSFCENNWPKKFIVFLLVTASFFFADPHWIGPLPFPSSSVTRFFGCYLLIFSTLIPWSGVRKNILVSLAWCIGFFWSAESAFYCTSIYFFIIVADTLSSTPGYKKISTIKRHLIIAFSTLLSVALFISAVYFIKIGTFPNFISYLDYAIGYASGYGYVPFPLNGPGNLMLLIFLGVGVLLLSAIREGEKNVAITLAAISGCIWAVASYYLGRPVPQNITALFPLLTFSSLLAISLAARCGLKNLISPLFAAAVPLYFLVLATYYSPTWWQQLPLIRSFSSDISLHLPKASISLEETLKTIDPNNSIPVVIFSDSAAAPYSLAIRSLNSEYSWLPTPLQLLMPPISKERQSVIMQRFICLNFKENGILIYQPGSISYAWPLFLSYLNQLLLVKNVVEVDGQIIYLFERNSSFDTLCNNTSK